ncbi:hypothetical protein ACFO6R_08415 [Eubacterium multiforme]|uniref:Uncharacterized protein n=1 Tax=Eubacterium multiforme TaxID=83339 RepID=A0ABT9UUS1_9FIRM|nr:hypothetical protein [Eubacterium multiforme]MDQ0150026.1 hypothetical protein [Eubacterium multiforme]
MKKKIFIINCITLFLIIIVYKILEYILKLNKLVLLNWVNFIFVSIFTILVFSILIQIIIFLYKIMRKSNDKTSTRILCKIGISLIVLSIGIYIFIGFVLYAFTDPEHIVEKDGKKMVAVVDSFLQVKVEYYDYINPFVRDNKLRIYEDYGNGGYDPFDSKEYDPYDSKIDSNEKITPKRITYYNDNEEIIKEIEK